MRFGRFAQGLLILTWATMTLDVTWTAPLVVLLIGSILGGAAIFCALFILQATLAFWTTESLEMINTVTYGGVETAQYPLTIYRKWFRRFFMYVIPLACANFFPAMTILQRERSLGFPVGLGWIAPFIGIVFFLVSLRVWGFGVRHYRSTGS